MSADRTDEQRSSNFYRERAESLDMSDPRVKLAREVLLGTLLDSYRAHRQSTALERELVAEASELTGFLTSKDTSTFAILAVSYMEDALRRRFAEQWAIVGSADQDMYFGANGPLSTFAQRLAVSKGVGWLTSEDLKQASILRKIRNHFAHNHKIHEVDSDPLLSLADALPAHERVLYAPRAIYYTSAYDVADARSRLRMRIFCASMAIVCKILVRSKLIAAHLPTDLRDGTGFSSLTELEQDFTDIIIRHCLASLNIQKSGLGD